MLRASDETASSPVSSPDVRRLRAALTPFSTTSIIADESRGLTRESLSRLIPSSLRPWVRGFEGGVGEARGEHLKGWNVDEKVAGIRADAGCFGRFSGKSGVENLVRNASPSLNRKRLQAKLLMRFRRPLSLLFFSYFLFALKKAGGTTLDNFYLPRPRSLFQFDFRMQRKRKK